MESAATEIQSPIQNPNLNLNDLPEELLLHILTFLPTPDAVRASLISRRWLSLWSRLPCLHFPYDHFRLSKRHHAPSPLSCHRQAVFVDRALVHYLSSSPITSFRLSFIFYHCYATYVDSWLRCALTRLQARELHLDFFVARVYHETVPDKYEFRLSLLSSSSLENLSLRGIVVVLPSRICFPSIRSLCIDCFELTDETLDRLIRGCPNLEELELQSGGAVPNVRICSASVKRVRIDYSAGYEKRNSFEIDCPNLVSLSFDCVDFAHFWLKNVSSLVEYDFSWVLNAENYETWSRTAKLLAFMPNLKRVKLQNWYFKRLLSMNHFPKEFMLRKLICLELQTNYTHYDLVGMAALLELCPNLETLILDYLNKRLVNEIPEEISNTPIILNIPRLKEVKIRKAFGTENESKFVTLLKKHGAALRKITVSKWTGCHDTHILM